MEPKVWGKYFWTSLHFIALGYPDNPSVHDKSNYKEFYTNFWKVIPCSKCGENYQRHLQELPIDEYLIDNLKLFEWTNKLHNLVNRELGKRQWSLQEARSKFSKIAKGQDDTFVSIDSAWDKIIRWSVTAVALLVVMLLIYMFIMKTLMNKK